MSIFDDEGDNRIRSESQSPFIPLEPGPYAHLGKKLGSDLLPMALEAFAGHKASEATAGVMSVINNAIGDPVGVTGGIVGEGAGWWADNLPVMAENAKILLEKVNDPNWWGVSTEGWR